MADVGPMTITARNREQAEYLVRSRAEQRGVRVHDVEVTEAGGGFLVTLAVDDADAVVAAELGEDTQVFHLHRQTRP
jgi:hypothetical protein